MHYTSEGIVLHVLPFKDHDRILTIFTRNRGVIKLLLKKSFVKNWRQSSLDPLTRGEFLYSQKLEQELGLCEDFSLISHHLELRKKWEWLDGACQMAYAIQRSQLIEKPAPTLYLLLARYLDKIPFAEDASALVNSFFLKVLRHEGLAHFSQNCLACEQSADPLYLTKGECYCKEHSPHKEIFFFKKEAQLLLRLAHAQVFHEITSIQCSEEFTKKVTFLFEKMHR